MNSDIKFDEVSKVYYYFDYFPKNLVIKEEVQELYENSIELSQNLLVYKNNNDEQVFGYFTNILEKSILDLVINKKIKYLDKIGLVVVPSSTVNKISAVTESIREICKRFEEGVYSRVLGANIKILDYSNLLKRTHSITKSHLAKTGNDRASYEENQESLLCGKNRLSGEWCHFILIDDILTRGVTMKSCYDLLLANGAKEIYLTKLVLAKTIDKRTL